MSKKSWLAGVLCALVFAAVSAGSALAGEVTGNGKNTPIKEDGAGASFCAFSGLDDDSTPVPPQTWGQIVGEQGPLGGANDTDALGFPWGCNPNLYPRG
jgi:hypothetical protein